MHHLPHPTMLAGNPRPFEGAEQAPSRITTRLPATVKTVEPLDWYRFPARARCFACGAGMAAALVVKNVACGIYYRQPLCAACAYEQVEHGAIDLREATQTA